MKRVEQETVVFEKVRWVCDDCKQPTLEGAKPFVCDVCGKEICRQCCRVSSLPEEADMFPMCGGCFGNREVFLREWQEEVERHGEAVARIRGRWRERSLSSS